MTDVEIVETARRRGSRYVDLPTPAEPPEGKSFKQGCWVAGVAEVDAGRVVSRTEPQWLLLTYIDELPS
jgi:hypothetical protein